MTDGRNDRLLKAMEAAEKLTPIPWEEFALSGVNWDEWPGGAAEILSSQVYFKGRTEELELQLKQAKTALADVREERNQFALVLREICARGLVG